ncbi:uncharacterized protein PAC_10539 [Phialocephala subalpina]|uniref:Translocation protein sec72 n=1 Tax=Phialocephala subalpina TaxID=576137 RepID=A0A1L7X6K5_9HELO|nr:uncharacterized protein PAC_10539 [Phialocephala subalpina]
MANTQPRLGLRITNPSPRSPKVPPKDFSRLPQTTNKQVRFILPLEIPPRQAINFHILRAQCLLSLDNPHNALQQADNAVKIAANYNVIALEPKAQLCRAKCLMKVERWEEAKLTLVRAASIRDKEGEVEELGRVCEYQLEIEKYTVDIEKHWRAILEEEAREKRG